MLEHKAESYEKPQIRELGSIHELTLVNKLIAAPSDGAFLSGQPLRTT
jgi:hypothetical protein